MHIRRIAMRRFMSHDETIIDLPVTGIVVVTGSNGSGKSSLVEAVSAGMWNKTLRGTPWWRDGEKTAVRLNTDTLVVERTRASKTKLTWEQLQQGAVSFETTTKSQTALESVVGPFDVWRRTAVFSSADAQGFSLATDADRKRLIENLLGLDKFDDALSACRADLKEARRASERARERYVQAKGWVDTSMGRIAALEELEGEKEPKVPDEPVDLVGDIDVRIARNQAALRDLRTQMQAATAGLGEARAELKRAKHDLRHFGNGSCATCGRSFDAKDIDVARERVTATHERVEREEAAAEETVAQLRAKALKREQRISDLRAKDREQRSLIDARERAISAHSQWSSRANAHAQKLAEEKATLAAKLEKLEERAEDQDDANHVVAELEAVERVLGLKGVRANVLGRALDGIEAVANSWLDRIFPGVNVCLRATSAKKTGGRADKISLTVNGLPHPHGYQGASGGQRRRIDVALTLALGEVAAASVGAEPGTLFLDEIFDSLDSEGVGLVAEALKEMSARRAIVVVTHSDVLASRLEASRRIRIEEGKVYAA